MSASAIVVLREMNMSISADKGNESSAGVMSDRGAWR